QPGLGPCSVETRGRRFHWRQMQIADGQAAAAVTAVELDLGIERGKRDERIRRLHRDAFLGPAEDRMPLVQPFTGRATAAGRALVAAPRQRCLRAEIRATRLLQQVAANGSAVSDLRRGGLQTGVGQHRGMLAYSWMLTDLVEGCERADGKRVARLLYRIQPGDTPDINHPIRTGYTQAEPIEQLSAAGNGHCSGAVGLEGIVRPISHFVSEIPHGASPSSSRPPRAPRR